MRELSREFGWVSWGHVRREKNRMADYLANVAMDSKGQNTITADDRGPRTTRRTRVEELMHNDTKNEGDGWEPSSCSHFSGNI